MRTTDRGRVAALARLDLAEVFRSRWLAFSVTLYAVLAGIFVLVGLRESTVLGFTGTGRVLLSVSHVLVLLLPLLALVATGQLVNRAREDGSLELLFSHPFARHEYFLALTAVRYAVIFLPFAALMLVTALLGRLLLANPVPWLVLGRSLAVCGALIWAFTGVGLAISVVVRQPARAVLVLLGVWVLGAALLDFGLIGLMLRFRLHAPTVIALAALNPVEAARLALLSSAEPTLAILGPVGFYLTHHLGPAWVTALGIASPVFLGTLAWLVALRRFVRGDLV